ncbi:MAG: PorT family protein [Flavobacteriales bacterium]|jgi:hypothetical protein|nr:PorT family protein [Flavobacteriales bacterium]
MKTKYFLTAIMSFILISFLAQTDTTNSPQPADTSKIMLGKTKIIIISDNEEDFLDSLDIDKADEEEDDEWAMVGTFHIGANGYLHNNQIGLPSPYQAMELDYSRSKSLGFDFMLRGLDLFNKRVYFSPGIGLDWNKYHFKDKQQMLSTQNDTVLFVVDSSVTYDKYKLRTTYLQVPVLLGFRLGNLDKKVVNVQVGAIAGYNIGALTKSKYAVDGTKYKNKVRDDYNVNPFKLDAVARVSFGDIGLFGRYSFTSLFEDNKAPTLTPFTVGLTFGSL